MLKRGKARSSSTNYAKEQEHMVESQLVRRGIKDKRVLDAMSQVPRHLFIPDDMRDLAYSDGPLPIGHGQTISQPYIVALMTEILELTEQQTVLELGTGSGYQAAILSRLVHQVYSIERHDALAQQAKKVLSQLGYDNIVIKVGDGTLGWTEHAPYNAIIVTAAAPDIPEPLTDQLTDGGCLVAPVGGRWSQELVKIKRQGETVVREHLTTVAFVPLVGKYGW
ncbi:MAG: protein-L-isoaspartate(D-aspartate) O-methyltransferase [Anaerolineales bacterium]|nr:protein-L-isoaspartate(D-aspartate) O-methyltransferase [Anaerolineales bacterium]